ncbi:SGNH/GDSL hydrolase family protein [Paenibacillus sp. GYB004]|uniref:SGNH/GDSL hydrolase family protein n=1 Tax=Paenibacillus sp. GYB004 TaxID=2994393 RepID=UPI002F9653DA
MNFRSNDKIVFIGDSITDKGRKTDPLKLGGGYVRLLHDYFATNNPELNLTVINEGTSGNRVTDLQKRWTMDVLDHQPDWLSVSIGINDVWRQLDSPDAEQVLPDRFEAVYRELLRQVRENCDSRLILMQPTIIKEIPDSTGNRMLQPYVAIVDRLAAEFGAVLVPTHEAFIGFLRRGTGKALTTDGVHMTTLGDMLMATTWLNTMQEAGAQVAALVSRG